MAAGDSTSGHTNHRWFFRQSVDQELLLNTQGNTSILSWSRSSLPTVSVSRDTSSFETTLKTPRGSTP